MTSKKRVSGLTRQDIAILASKASAYNDARGVLNAWLVDAMTHGEVSIKGAKMLAQCLERVNMLHPGVANAVNSLVCTCEECKGPGEAKEVN